MIFSPFPGLLKIDLGEFPRNMHAWINVNVYSYTTTHMHAHKKHNTSMLILSGPGTNGGESKLYAFHTNDQKYQIGFMPHKCSAASQILLDAGKLLVDDGYSQTVLNVTEEEKAGCATIPTVGRSGYGGGNIRTS